MGCQTKIASQIVEQGADDILAVKNYQPGLAKAGRESFESSDEQEETKDLVNVVETQDDVHGRTEIRRCTVLQTSSKHPLPPAWEPVAAMIRIESERSGAERSEGGKTTPHTRYFTSSTWINAKDFLAAIRQHWNIENHLHWVLDVVFRADNARLQAETRPKTSWSSSIWPLISCRTSKARKLTSTSDASNWRAACNDRFLLNILASCPNSMRLPWGPTES